MRRDCVGDVVGSDLEGSGVVLIAAVGSLSRDGGGEEGEEGDGCEGLHGEYSWLKRMRNVRISV